MHPMITPNTEYGRENKTTHSTEIPNEALPRLLGTKARKKRQEADIMHISTLECREFFLIFIY
jgi:hypothetical protein